MKLQKLLSIGALAAAAANTPASAATLHIVGSTAFRASVTQAIFQVLGGAPLTVGGTTTVNYATNKGGGAVNVLGSSYGVFQSADGTMTVETYWTGSLAGVVDLVATTTDPFPSPNQTVPAMQLSTTGGTLGSGYVKETVAPDIAMSDSFFGSISQEIATSSFSGAVGTYTTPSALAAAIKGSALKDGGTTRGPVGIVPFEFITGNITAATTGSATVSPSFTNITSTVAQNLIAGPTPVSLSTGNPSDKNSYMYLIGRNEDSGTRIDTFAVAGQTVNPTNGVFQEQVAFANNQQAESTSTTTANPTGGYTPSYSPGTPGGTQAIATVAVSEAAGSTPKGVSFGGANTDAFPVEQLNTEPNIGWGLQGHSGYIAGGDVANVLSAFNSQTTLVVPANAPSENTGNVYYVGYVGLADATKVLYGTELQYNGVKATPATIANGSYNLWSMEHYYYKSTLSSTVTTLSTNIANAIRNTYACSDAYGKVAASTSVADESTVTSPSDAPIPNIFDGSGLFIQSASYTVTNDGAPYTPTY
jgi:hypothetical protein